ncbi:transcriptional regulator, LysR family [Pseudodesulfovibrio mercurii]|uniref:Transcriptional regulator, LysR family n=1 Tax=Pseudodesulfovibrio mercurii TaxID=641491 RepID=F0JC30_9BACT|nr:LysR family transcriptional regulator [Pseudodesulfovibrio mercurii]EGB15603.1 transcriptional regulator, LysR family [Pseudodesulfovibrio mercurii]
MNFTKLLYFKTIVEQGQISRAARVLHMSQPPLSQRLKELEDELGVTLIERAGTNWAVTSEGKALYQRALDILDLVNGIPDEIQASRLGVEGLVTLGCTTLSLSLLAQFIPAMNRLHPRIAIRLLVDDSTVLKHKLAEHAIDFCVTITPFTETGLHIIPLQPTESVLVVPPSLATPSFTRAAASGVELDIRELHEKPLVIFRRFDGGGTYMKTMDILHEYKVKPKIILDSPDGRILLDMLEQGLEAMALVPGSEIPERLKDTFVFCRLPDSFPKIMPCLAVVKNRYLPRASRTVWKELCAFTHRPDVVPGAETPGECTLFPSDTNVPASDP